MMDLYLITFASELHKQASVHKSHETLLSEIEKYFTVHIVNHKDIGTLSNDDFKLVFIATGGTERLFVQHFESLPHPVMLLTDGLQNSLAAALEISSWVRSKGMKAQIIHGEIQNVILQILAYHSNFKSQWEIRGKRIGVLGTPSSWLIASNVDYLLAKRRWGVEFIDVQLKDIIAQYDEITDDEVGRQSVEFASRALACREATPEDLIKAMRLYKAVRNICKREKLDAITLSCFALISQTGTTGCLTLSLLNDDGILAGCEGDLQSIFTLLAVKTVTGQTGFMANPSLINEKNNELMLAHCTIGTKLTEQFIIRNHFESDSGVAIQGILPAGDVTIVKCSGECLDEYFVSSGSLTENTNYVNACRTQVRVKLNSPVDYFLRSPLGNHHILIQGNYEKELNSFFASNSCKRTE